jgi:type IV secretion system protein VirB3
MQTTPLFVGLTRPASYAGLPVTYVVFATVIVMIIFVNTQSLTFLVVGGLSVYGMLRILAAYDPRIIEVWMTTIRYTPLTGSYITGYGVTYRA